MQKWKPDQTFYPSPLMAMTAEREKIAYLALMDPKRERPDAIAVMDVDPASPTYGTMLSQVEMPGVGDELHHFGWNACSSCLCPYAPHPHMERRYLVVPGLRSSNIYILDTRPDPKKPRLVKTIPAAEIMQKTGYSRMHTVHCGPDGIYVNALGGSNGDGGPGGIFMLDPETFEIKGPWEKERGPQRFAYDFWWHLGHDTMITSEWGTPAMFENGLVPEMILGNRYGHRLHVWDLDQRKHQQVLELGEEHQMVFELRPAHDPAETYGFVGVVVSTKDLSASVWLWYREGGNGAGDWKIRKVIEIPAEPADPALLPPMLKGFGAVPPFITDINLSLDDKFLYVSCWGTGELRQYDVSDPFRPVLTAVERMGGIVARAAHPADPAMPLNGGPQMVEVSRDGRRVYVTNALYGVIDDQFYPDGIRGWMIKLDAGKNGGMTVDPKFFPEFDGMRPHQVRLEGGDSSSDSYCYSAEAA